VGHVEGYRVAGNEKREKSRRETRARRRIAREDEGEEKRRGGKGRETLALA
jgi:hypothetical protein